ncbi:RagB/SusD family nutrient uptake outer membrane protein [Sphingobacterium yanglingense]|uniref:SusD-like starch-binding protein associating with outer membrane n=1 Tax=Sphingobacterium yanglingense TaxID=1437280 RepID=A0A4R6WEE3_9SPHI|nr:RagB/SusD family nutrient uptake outer membrane protein [Sphingobacterium yanglingense]TDQ78113.1 SusD-like starch-binding protein associating with outer membrane [Sphingobacterium yanglingense]
MSIKYIHPYTILALIAVSCTLLSCEKFLEEPPSKTSALVVKTTAQLNALLDNQSTFYREENRAQTYGTDDWGLTVNLYNGGRSVLSNIAAIQFATWDTQFLLNEQRDNLWTEEYKKIFTANMALSNLDNVTGTEQEKAIIKADAHFIRAYSYWILANTYCLPYTDANKNELGLPLKTSTSFEEAIERQSLEKVYQLIESDLSEALKTPVSLTQSGRAKHWRASKEGVNAFAARYYLHKNDYNKTIAHANAVLQDYSTLVDYNTEMRYGIDGTVGINAGTQQAETVTLKYPYTHDNQSDQTDMIGWKEFLYFRMLSVGTWWYIPSQELLALYDQTNDLRYQYHMVENYSYDRGMVKPAYSYPGYVFFFKEWIPSGPTVAEVLLMKAEAQARTDDYMGAINTLNILRAKRMKPGTWVTLTATSKDDAIKKILEERRREMPFVQRWFDIRRYNNNEDPNDDVVLTRDFYPYNGTNVLFNESVKTYSLPKNSRRYASPIPVTEIISSNGAIVQNTY